MVIEERSNPKAGTRSYFTGRFFEPSAVTKRFGDPRPCWGEHLRSFMRQIALRALETRRPGKRRRGTPLDSCVALAEAHELPVNRNHPE
jgi:hypothetical protein